MITPQQALTRLIEQREIFYDEMLSLMRQIMGGEVTPVQIAGILIGLRVKKETVGEISAAAQVMREFATKVPVSQPHPSGGYLRHRRRCRTHLQHLHRQRAGRRGRGCAGGQARRAFGVFDLRLGGRAGSAGRQPAPEPRNRSAQCIDQIGIGFMFAPNFHGAMKYAAPVRRELGVRTMFNVLGPLTNPAGADNQVMGVFHQDLVGIQARVLQRLGSRHVLVVHGADGMDEISISDGTYIAELKDGQVSEYTVHPDLFGLTTAPLNMLRVANIDEAREKLLGVLNDEVGAPRDIVQLNAGAAIYVAGLTRTLEEGVAKADQVIASGAAKAKLDQLIALSNSFKT